MEFGKDLYNHLVANDPTAVTEEDFTKAYNNAFAGICFPSPKKRAGENFSQMLLKTLVGNYPALEETFNASYTHVLATLVTKCDLSVPPPTPTKRGVPKKGAAAAAKKKSVNERAQCTYEYPADRARATHVCTTRSLEHWEHEGKVLCKVHYDRAVRYASDRQRVILPVTLNSLDLEKRGKFVVLKGTGLVIDNITRTCTGKLVRVNGNDEIVQTITTEDSRTCKALDINCVVQVVDEIDEL